MTIIKEIVTQHTEESAFLWLLRNRAVHEPHYNLSDLAKLDDRVDAHLDGLRIAGEEGWDTCREALKFEAAGEVFAASVLAFDSSIKERIQTVLEAAGKDYELTRGVASALGWLPFEEIKTFAFDFMTIELPAWRRIGLAACAVHRKDPGHHLMDALSDSDPSLKSRALCAVGELGLTDLLPVISAQFNEEDEHCRFFAAWSAALLGHASAALNLRHFVDQNSVHAEKAFSMALRKMKLSDSYGWLQAFLKEPEHKRLSLIGIGAVGDPLLIPWLIDSMGTPELARVAGESFSMITGLDLAYEDLEGEWPEGFEAGPTENPEDEDVDMDPDEDLPWPEPALIQEWWHKNTTNFKSGVRHLCGKPITEEHCQHVLRYGYQRQRAAAAMELAMMHPGQPLFNVKAPGFRQKKLLGLA